MIRYLNDTETRYVIEVDHRATDRRENRPQGERFYKTWHLHDNDGDALTGSLGVRLLSRRGFGAGVRFGRNGSESDVGLDLHCGRLFDVWLRLKHPWLRRFRVAEGKPDPYSARHTAIRFFHYQGHWVGFEIDAVDGRWSKSDPWWRHWSFGHRNFWGGTTTEWIELDGGTTGVPMPEGVYEATWVLKRCVHTAKRFPLTVRDRLFGKGGFNSYDLEIEGGIPSQGKGENSWDCGMDGLFGVSGRTVEEAVGRAVESVLKDRKRNGGPHDLPRPMSVREAEQYVRGEMS